MELKKITINPGHEGYMVENIEIRPPSRTIGLTITENGSGAYYFNTKENVNIYAIDVKAIFSEGAKWVENNSYSFSVSEIKKKKVNIENANYQHSIVVKMIDSPYVPCNFKSNPLCLRFYIYYTLEGEEKRIIADTTKPENILSTNKGEPLIYRSKTYTDRALWPYSLQLDSIYRPFFFNSILLFLDGNVVENGLEGETYAKFYFSIANGCTMRNESFPLYKLGDIKLSISNLNEKGVKNENSLYNFIIKENYRTFSEIEDFGNGESGRGKLLKEAHIRGIRECGTKDSENGGGIFLPIVDNDGYFLPQHYYGASLTPTETVYFQDGYEFETNLNNYVNGITNSFDTKRPLNVKFSVNDASLRGEDFKTIEVDCMDIRFPELTRKNGSNIISMPYSGYSEDTTFIKMNDVDITDLYNVAGGLNVYDGSDNIFSFLYNKHYGNEPSEIAFGYNPEAKQFEYTASTSNIYILAVYHGGYENEGVNEENEEVEKLLTPIKHTSKLLIMKLYKFE